MSLNQKKCLSVVGMMILIVVMSDLFSSMNGVHQSVSQVNGEEGQSIDNDEFLINYQLTFQIAQEVKSEQKCRYRQKP